MTQLCKHNYVICLLREDNNCLITFVFEYRILFYPNFFNSSSVGIACQIPPSATILPLPVLTQRVCAEKSCATAVSEKMQSSFATSLIGLLTTFTFVWTNAVKY